MRISTGAAIATAVSLGVTPRAGTDLSAVPDPLPLRVILADHRAGAASLSRPQRPPDI